MYHFFAESSQLIDDGKRIIITDSDYNHMVNVLRMKPGEEFSVSFREEEDKEYRFGIESVTDTELVGELRFVKESGVELPAKIYLFQGLPKADKMELIIQKAVELGVYQVIPVSMKRSVVKLDEKRAANKIKRWQAIAEAAAKQSKRAFVPEIGTPMSFKEAINFCLDMEVKLLPYEQAEGMTKTRELIEAVRPGQSIAVFIGPEGGFADEEVSFAMEAGFNSITMGKRILRTETAGFTMLAWLMYHLEA
ncbi:16S rRNA (uracil(1498)-N(3))-methyltransferase [Butyrivibrio sp. XPD2002]|uniref:16S rRNA (uracil(1498)-N(3))-methyltransferase n=1 Tax=Butyrivibrio sp. XPD2002 TaxID=1280665 RepID=UPI0003FA8165|nr:16S rRNA (uracil(1498)-N(3))-methyltransferase [Butyrivibrio sp. XPD2002]